MLLFSFFFFLLSGTGGRKTSRSFFVEYRLTDFSYWHKNDNLYVMHNLKHSKFGATFTTCSLILAYFITHLSLFIINLFLWQILFPSTEITDSECMTHSKVELVNFDSSNFTYKGKLLLYWFQMLAWRPGDFSFSWLSLIRTLLSETCA